ncbi:MAG: arginase family protein [Chloroflexi bacterium]|nr:arginase family protein [Chloroflexota bacterium]
MPAPPPFRAPTLPLQASTPLPLTGSDRPRVAAAVFGAGLDLTESVRSGAGAAPPVIRERFDALERYSPELDRDLDDLTFYDLGDLELDGLPMTAALDAIDAALTHAARVAAVGVVLGGEHTASLGACRGIKRVHPDALLLQLDAHAPTGSDAS